MKSKLIMFIGMLLLFIGFIMGSTHNWFDFLQWCVLFSGVIIIVDQLLT